MTPLRRQKLSWVLATIIGAIIAVAVIIYAIGEQTDYYFDPSAIATGKAPSDTRIRAGGMVVQGSVKRDAQNPININFAITDFAHTVPVVYQGVLPDLFAENSGVVATGKVQNGVFIAQEVLAKHDENYMPPDVAKSLKDDYYKKGTPAPAIKPDL